MGWNRQISSGAAIGFIVAVLTGCATVKPEADYQRASKIINDRTGVSQVYNPAADSQVQQSVAQLLDGGLTVDEAVRTAFLNNKAFQALFYDIGVSRAEVVQSGLLTNPVLSLAVRAPTPGGRANITFGLAQELADLWHIPVKKRIAKAQLEQTLLKVAQAAIDLQAQAKTAYYKLVALRLAGEAAQENLALVGQSLKVAQDRFNAGEATVLDVNLIQANVLDIQMQMAILQRDEQTARASFERILGLGGHKEEVRLTDSLPEVKQAIPDDASLIAAAAARFDVRRAALEVDAAEEDLVKQFRSILPNLSVGIDGERPDASAPKSLSWRYLENEQLIKPPNQTAQDRQLDAAHTLGDYVRDRIRSKRERDLAKRETVSLLLGPSLQVTVPVWDQNRAQIAKARFTVMRKRKEFDELVETLSEDVKKGAATVRAAETIVRKFAQEVMPLAEKNVQTARRAYEAGLESILVLTEAQRNLVRQKTAFVNAKGDYAAALADLERAAGGRLNPDGKGGG